jgi:hypothetical protein
MQTVANRDYLALAHTQKGEEPAAQEEKNRGKRKGQKDLSWAFFSRWQVDAAVAAGSSVAVAAEAWVWAEAGLPSHSSR